MGPTRKAPKAGNAAGLKKKGKRAASDSFVEDLDLDMGSFFPEKTHGNGPQFEDEEEQHIVMNQRGRGVAGDADVLEVLPREAHNLGDLGGYYEPGARAEEEQLAVETVRKQRGVLADEDFEAADIVREAAKGRRAKAAQKQQQQQQRGAAPAPALGDEVIEKVERDFRAVSSEQRLAMLQQEAPEVLRMVEEFRTAMTQVKSVSAGLHKLLHGKKAPPEQQHLVSFLETKVQLLLSYCMHITFYLLLKLEGVKVASHPVVDRLVELRVYVEKLWPLEQKLQYSINQLLAGAGGASSRGGGSGGGAAVGERARVGELRPVAEGTTKSLQKAAAASAGKIEARRNMRKLRDMEALEEAQLGEMNRGRARKAPQLSMSVDEIRGGLGGGYQEQEDQYFSRLVGDPDGDSAASSGSSGGDSDDASDDAGALISKLRARVGRKSKTFHGEAAAARDEDEDEDENEDDDAFLEGDEDGEEFGEEEDLFDTIADEDEELRQARAAHEEATQDMTRGVRSKLDSEVKRRQISRAIETHRGLTKARPKDRKTPRTAQRRKYEKGSRIAKTQSREVHKEAPRDFSGVANLKPHVTHSTRY